MGTSIHPFIEYDIASDNPAPFCLAMDGTFDLRAFNTGEFFVFNDYELFDALAFGRSALIPEGRHNKKRPLFRARGLPANLTREVALRFYHVVLDENYDKNRFDPRSHYYGSLSAVSRVQAMEWVQAGKSQWGINIQWKLSKQSISFDLVSNPTWHTPSWLTLEEISKSLQHFEFDIRSVPVEFHAIMEAMKALENHYGHGKSRLVFWFDT